MLTGSCSRQRNCALLFDQPMCWLAVVLMLMAASTVAAAAAVAGHREVAELSDSTAFEEIRSRTRREADKRARLASWGKREPAVDGLAVESPTGDLLQTDEEETEADRDKRRGRMAAWGKKSVDGAADKATRSKWSSGSMSVWGKRSASGIDVLEDYDDKRSKWNGGSLAVWGKRGWHDKGNLAVWG